MTDDLSERKTQFEPVQPEDIDMDVECRECRRVYPASEMAVAQDHTPSNRNGGVLKVTRTYYCSEECARDRLFDLDETEGEDEQ